MLLLYKDDVMHMQHLNRAPYYTPHAYYPPHAYSSTTREGSLSEGGERGVEVPAGLDIVVMQHHLRIYEIPSLLHLWCTARRGDLHVGVWNTGINGKAKSHYTCSTTALEVYY